MDEGGSRIARWVAPVLVGATALHFWARNLADPDLWGHLTWGRMMLRDRTLPRTDTFSYTAFGRPFFDHEWLADLATAAAFDGAGAWGLIALKLGLGALMVLSMVDAVRTLARDSDLGRPIHPFAVAAGLVLALAVIAPGATFRPQLFTMAFTATVWALLLRADRRLRTAAARSCVGWELGCLPPLLALWANLHGGFLVGVGLVGLHAVAVVLRLFRRMPGAPMLRDATIVAGLAALGAAAPLCNPYGVELYQYLAGTLHLHDGVSEWDPVPLLGPAFLRFKLLALATGVLMIHWWRTERSGAGREPLGWVFTFLVLTTWYAFRHQRHTVLFAIVAAPILIVAMERLRVAVATRRPALVPRPPVMRAIAVGVFVLAAAQLAGVARDFVRHGAAIRYSRHVYPTDALAFLRQHGFRGNLVLPFHWGTYTIHRLGDRVRVFIDGRFEAVYPHHVLDDYFAFIHGRDGWARVLDAYPTDLVLLQRAHGIHPLLFARDDFAYVYSDRTALVFVRRNATNQTALDGITRMARRPPLPVDETVFP
jgi:hypothetical protein